MNTQEFELLNRLRKRLDLGDYTTLHTTKKNIGSMNETYKTLNQCYKRCSLHKMCAYEQCTSYFYKVYDEFGYNTNYGISGYNTFAFTYKIVFADNQYTFVIVFTKDKTKIYLKK